MGTLYNSSNPWHLKMCLQDMEGTANGILFFQMEPCKIQHCMDCLSAKMLVGSKADSMARKKVALSVASMVD